MNNNKKVSLFLLLNSPSFYLLLYIFYLSLDTFLLCFVFFHLYYPSTNYAHKKRCILRESTLVKKKLLVFTFSPVFSNKNSIIYFFFFLFSRDLREVLFHIELLLDQVVGDEKSDIKTKSIRKLCLNFFLLNLIVKFCLLKEQSFGVCFLMFSMVFLVTRCAQNYWTKTSDYITFYHCEIG